MAAFSSSVAPRASKVASFFGRRYGGMEGGRKEGREGGREGGRGRRSEVVSHQGSIYIAWHPHFSLSLPYCSIPSSFRPYLSIVQAGRALVSRASVDHTLLVLLVPGGSFSCAGRQATSPFLTKRHHDTKHWSMHVSGLSLSPSLAPSFPFPSLPTCQRCAAKKKATPLPTNSCAPCSLCNVFSLSVTLFPADAARFKREGAMLVVDEDGRRERRVV